MGDNPLIFLDITISGEKVGRIVCELFANKAPKTVSNFRSLCLGDHSIGPDTALTYKRNYFHRVIKNFMVQCGDIVHCSDKYLKSDFTGKGGRSIFASEEEIENCKNFELQCYGNFESENMAEFDAPFYLAMANTGTRDTNSSQFFITTCTSPHLNGKHSIFGRVIHGKFVVRTIERSNVDSDGFPIECIRIEDCGDWDESKGVPIYNASNDTIGGDIYEELPDDNEGMDDEDFNAAFLAANTIKESGTLLFKNKEFQKAYFKYQKSLRYINEYIPDIDVDKENNAKFTILKMKLYLNLSLVLLKMGNYDESIKYSSYLLEMDSVPDKDQAKAFYRRGDCYLVKKRLEDALSDFKFCKEKNSNDTLITGKIQYIENLMEMEKEKRKQNIAKFFSDSRS